MDTVPRTVQRGQTTDNRTSESVSNMPYDIRDRLGL
jgi:hypothetical protein